MTWLAVLRLGLVHRFTYRLEAAVAVVSALAVVVVNTSLWSAAGEVAGMGRPALSTYVVVAWLASAVCGSRLEEQVGERFRTGFIAADLARPLDLQAWLMARDTGRALASAVLTAVPVFAVMALFFPLSLPPLATWPLFGISLLLAASVGQQIGFLTGIAAFRLGHVAGVAHLKAALVILLSGAVVPVAAFPDAVRPVVLALPFQAIAHAPASVFLGAGAGPLAAQAAWALGLLVVCRLAWSGAVRRLVVLGG